MKNEPAFPSEDRSGTVFHIGLTKREIFAAMAMQGFCSSFDYLRHLDARALECKTSLEKATAKAAISYADALIAALEEKE